MDERKKRIGGREEKHTEEYRREVGPLSDEGQAYFSPREIAPAKLLPGIPSGASITGPCGVVHTIRPGFHVFPRRKIQAFRFRRWATEMSALPRAFSVISSRPARDAGGHRRCRLRYTRDLSRSPLFYRNTPPNRAFVNRFYPLRIRFRGRHGRILLKMAIRN